MSVHAPGTEQLHCSIFNRALRVRVNRFSNRPFRVKRFQTNHHHSSVDVAHGLVLLFGIGTRPLYGAFLVKRFR